LESSKILMWNWQQWRRKYWPAKAGQLNYLTLIKVGSYDRASWLVELRIPAKHLAF
jgi:hypothetical protein